MAGQKTLILGSCFAANLGEKMLSEGRDVCVNPFGTLFNPVSIRQSIDRLQSGRPFTEDECVMMGAGAGLWCSFSHYTKFARKTKEEFLKNANARLAEASEYFKNCDRLIITFGTAWCFRHIEKNLIVSNCLKIPAREFERFRLKSEEIVKLYKDLDKPVIFTVSPIRHLADTLHGNQLSKATLLLAIDELISMDPGNRSYFPSYEMMIDELRDYKWYAEDTVHPSDEAVKIICERFLSTQLIPK